MNKMVSSIHVCQYHLDFACPWDSEDKHPTGDNFSYCDGHTHAIIWIILVLIAACSYWSNSINTKMFVWARLHILWNLSSFNCICGSCGVMVKVPHFKVSLKPGLLPNVLKSHYRSGVVIAKACHHTFYTLTRNQRIGRNRRTDGSSSWKVGWNPRSLVTSWSSRFGLSSRYTHDCV